MPSLFENRVESAGAASIKAIKVELAALFFLFLNQVRNVVKALYDTNVIRCAVYDGLIFLFVDESVLQQLYFLLFLQISASTR